MSIGSPEILALFVFIPLGLAIMGFWIWMLLDCATREPPEGNDKIVWVGIILFLQILGALLYYFVRRPRRRAELGY